MDEQLRILNMASLPEALGSIDDRILQALDCRRREAAAMQRMMALAAFVSLGVGIFSGGVVARPAVAASPLSPFVPASALAPSTLLVAR